MSRDVTIFLRSSQRYPQQEPEEMELTVHGKLYFRGGCFFVSYEESAMTGLEDTRTTLKVEPERVEIIRTGKNHSRLCFQEGLRHESPYRTPYGLLQLATVTHSLTSVSYTHLVPRALPWRGRCPPGKCGPRSWT